MPVNVVEGRRASGILLHPTSLPGGVVGDLGAAAYRFVDWLADAGQSYWQILPLTAADEGGSPYNGLSAVAGNPLLIALDDLVEEGLLHAGDVEWSGGGEGEIDYRVATPWKEERLSRAHAALLAGAAPHLERALEEYAEENASWLEDYALFRALRDAHGGAPWTEWDPEIRSRDPAALKRAHAELETEVRRRIFQQYLFDRQWTKLRRYAGDRGISIVGDIPIFVAHDSADVWAHPELFGLDESGRPVVVSGVPPDYFSETGQRWGNPLYRWEVMRDRGYDWWVRRFRRTLSWVDVVRVDHFRGFESYWEIPGAEETAINGRWRPGPGAEFFQAVERELVRLPVIAEDLGIITRSVEELRDALGFPGMRVLQFAFDGDPENPHLPENYPAHAVVYTGTHDNDTIAGWWEKASAEEREAVSARIGAGGEIHWALISMVMESDAALAIVPVQDVLGLGSEARMNTPGTMAGNWSWRLHEGALTRDAQMRLLDLTRRTGRAPQPTGAKPEPGRGR